MDRDWESFQSRRDRTFPEYATALFEVFWPGGQNTLLSRDGLRSGIPPEQDLLIITAYNPGLQRPDSISNRSQNQKLKEALTAAGLSIYDSVGRSPDGSHQEPSFAVALEEARRSEQIAYVASVAGKFDQAAIFLWNSRLRKGQTIWLAQSSEDSP